RGVIEAADNEAQLAGVMAHEISHVALRHGTNQASKASAAQMPLAILGGLLGSDSTAAALTQLGANFAVNSVLLKYSRTAETQADTLGTQILYDSGYDARAMAQFFEKIQAQDQGGQPVEFFSNHPNPDNRVERVGQEVDNLGGVRRGSNTDSRDFQQIKRLLQSLPATGGGDLQAGGQHSSEPELLILSARYGAGDRFNDVRQRLQSRIENNRLELNVNNSSMGGDPVSRSKTLQLTYQWGNRTYEITVRENHRFSIPTEEQISDNNRGDSEDPSNTDRPSDRFVSIETRLLRINHPDDWQVYGQGDAMTIAPRGGMVEDGNGNQAMAYGMIVNLYEPATNRFGQRLQGPGYGQGSGQDSLARLEQSTDALVQELRLSNRNMRVIRRGELIRVSGEQGLSTYLSNDSPLGGRETNWLITLRRPEGLLFFVFTAPDRDFRSYESAFQQMLYSVRIKQ
ncbi:MAG TPA: M48 family metallopeptidase, partial [Acidobacteriota bacterium]|nr:M48 family metallopeptidase [Acidobacteriota bacterium]